MFRKTSTHDAEPRFQEETILNQLVFAELLFTKLICVPPMGGFSGLPYGTLRGTLARLLKRPLLISTKKIKKTVPVYRPYPNV